MLLQEKLAASVAQKPLYAILLSTSTIKRHCAIHQGRYSPSDPCTPRHTSWVQNSPLYRTIPIRPATGLGDRGDPPHCQSHLSHPRPRPCANCRAYGDTDPQATSPRHSQLLTRPQRHSLFLESTLCHYNALLHAVPPRCRFPLPRKEFKNRRACSMQRLCAAVPCIRARIHKLVQQLLCKESISCTL